MSVSGAGHPVEVGWQGPEESEQYPMDQAWSLWMVCRGCGVYRTSRISAGIALNVDLAEKIEELILGDLHPPSPSPS